MKYQDIRAIECAIDRGMQFHVFADDVIYVNGKPAIEKIYKTSWNSLGMAQMVAKDYVNPVIFNSFYEVVK